MATAVQPTPAGGRHDPLPPVPGSGQLIWGGLRCSAWLRLLARHRFRVGPGYRAAAVRITAVSLLGSALRLLQDFRHGRQAARTAIREPPLFVLGFFRSGTTLLHDLLGLDPRHTCPNTYECFMANNFLLTEGFVTRRLPLRTTRPMDDVPLAWDQPQEDEFALCMMGQPSFYLSFAFPNDPPQHLDYLSLEAVPARAREAWKRDLYRFVQAVSFKRPGRLVLKSPPHTARIKILLELFPEARFVHIVRDPYQVYDSTVRMIRALYTTCGLQRPTGAGLEDLVLNLYRSIMSKLEEDRPRVAASRFYELRYEDLVRDTAGAMRAVYEHLGLGDFGPYRPRLEQFLAGTRGYSPGHHQLSAEVRANVTRHWGEFIRRHGYAEDPADARS